MATADSSTLSRAPDFSASSDLAASANPSQPLFTLSQGSFLELVAILSAYSDLLALMDSGLPEYVFLSMLNDRFSAFAFSLRRSSTLDPHAP